MTDDFYYVERDGVPVPATNEEWREIWDSPDRIVARDNVGFYWVSTVFLGLNHNFGPGPPLVYETMVFDQSEGEIAAREEAIGFLGTLGTDQLQIRSSTRAEAERHHRAAVRLARRWMRRIAAIDEEIG